MSDTVDVNVIAVPGTKDAESGVIATDVACIESIASDSVPALVWCVASPLYVAVIVMVLCALTGDAYDTVHVPADKSQNEELKEPPLLPSSHIIDPAGETDDPELSVTVATSVTWPPAEMLF